MFAVLRLDVADVGGEQFCDLVEFPALDRDEEFGCELAVGPDEYAAMRIAEVEAGTAPDRWVNTGMAGAEYRDYVMGGRRWPL